MRKVRSVVVYEALKERVLTGDLATGERLVVRELAHAFGVSDIPVREALWMLARDGLVDMNAYSGARVASLTRDEIQEVLVIRANLEGLATELAAERIDEEGLATLRDLLEQQERMVHSAEPDPLAYAALNRRFHGVIFQHTANGKLTELIANIWAGHAHLQTVFRLFPGRLRSSLDEHRAIYDALVRRDAASAGRLAADHKRLQLHDLLAVVDQEADDARKIQR